MRPTRISSCVYSNRIREFRRLLEYRGVDAAVISSLQDVRYFCGFTGDHGLLCVRRAHAILLTDSRFALQVREEVHGVRTAIVMGSLLHAVLESGFFRGCRRVGIEEGELDTRQYRLLRKTSKGMNLIAVDDDVQTLMSVKDGEEVSAIAAAAGISVAVFRDIVPLLKPGIRECEIAAEITYRHRLHGAGGDAFEPIVASGERSALPHAVATDRILKRGDVVVLDFGCTVNGYASDVTRTVVLGRPSKYVQNVYRVVREAQELAIMAVTEGAAAKEIDALARKHIDREGFRKEFGHSLGHGVGLRIHERPRLSPLSQEILTAGNVTTVEPGIYLPGEFGVRIEDDVVVRRGGCDILTCLSRELIVL